MKRIVKLALALVRELSDQNAYRRHLAAHQREDSPQEWRRFQDHHLRAKYLRARCC